MNFLPAERRPSVAVVGFGYVGSCIGVTLADCGIRVFGVDSNPLLVREMNEGFCRFYDPGLREALARNRNSGLLTVSGTYEAIGSCDVVIIAVGTPVAEDRSIITEYLESACGSIAPLLRVGQLVILKSTVPPGTTQDLVRPLLEKGGLTQGIDFGLAFCPERLAEGNALGQFRTLPIIVGGCDRESTAAATKFWSDTLDVRVEQFASPEVAELVKLADNWWIDVNIALANELARLCGELQVDVLDVISGANTLPKGSGHVNVLLPSVGVGGSCLTKDPWILWSVAREKGMQLRMAETSRQVNDAMPDYTFGLIENGLTSLGKAIESAKVTVLGLAFKNNTNDLRHTPVRRVVERLRASGCSLALFDPLVTEETVPEFGIDQASSLEEAVQGADCVAVLAGHAAFQSLDFPDLAARVSTPCLVVDGRAYYSQETIKDIRDSGLIYRGIGR